MKTITSLIVFLLSEIIHKLSFFISVIYFLVLSFYYQYNLDISFLYGLILNITLFLSTKYISKITFDMVSKDEIFIQEMFCDYPELINFIKERD